MKMIGSRSDHAVPTIVAVLLLGDRGLVDEEAAALPVVGMALPCLLDCLEQVCVPSGDNVSIRPVPVFLVLLEPR